MQGSKSMIDKVEMSNVNQKNTRCVHFYACICAFASDEKLAEEFEYYINLDHSYLTVPRPLGSNLRSNESEKFISMGKYSFICLNNILFLNYNFSLILDVEGLTEDTHLLIFRDDAFTVHNIESNLNTVNLDTAILSENIADNIKICDQNLFDDTGIISQVLNLELFSFKIRILF